MVHTSSGVQIFFKDTATTENYTLSPHDALPICVREDRQRERERRENGEGGKERKRGEKTSIDGRRGEREQNERRDTHTHTHLARGELDGVIFHPAAVLTLSTVPSSPPHCIRQKGYC